MAVAVVVAVVVEDMMGQAMGGVDGRCMSSRGVEKSQRAQAKWVGGIKE